MAKVIAITNQKGGVGKTTTAINLAASLFAQGCSVLLIDLDPQGNATMGVGVDKTALSLSSNEVLLGQASAEEAIVTSESGLDLLPASGELTVAEVSLVKQANRHTCLKASLEKLQSKYQYMLIDCPPSLNILTINALVAANSALIPMQCEYYALEGLAALINTIEQIKSTIKPDFEIEGILRTMYDSRNRLCKEVSAQLLDHFAEKVYRTVVPRNVRLAEAPSHGQPALQYDKKSAGAAAYRVLASEIMGKQTVREALSEV